MNCKYVLIRDTYNDKNSVKFGIAAIDDSGNIIAEAHDVSENEDKVIELIHRCNKLELSSIHFFEVVSDFINACA